MTLTICCSLSYISSSKSVRDWWQLPQSLMFTDCYRKWHFSRFSLLVLFALFTFVFCSYSFPLSSYPLFNHPYQPQSRILTCMMFLRSLVTRACRSKARVGVRDPPVGRHLCRPPSLPNWISPSYLSLRKQLHCASLIYVRDDVSDSLAAHKNAAVSSFYLFSCFCFIPQL